MKKHILLALVLLSMPAKGVEKDTILKCNYVAGIARETQNIRQTENDNWVAFEYKIRLIYKADQGVENLLTIAKLVYDYAPIETPLSDVFYTVFDQCRRKEKKRAPGEELAV